MILVKSVEIEHVGGREAQIAITQPLMSPWISNDPSEVHHTRELVQARVFINKNNEEVIVGFSQEVQKALGAPMEAFRNMSKDIERLTHQNRKLDFEIIDLENKLRRLGQVLKMTNRRYLSASFWQRLKYLFLRKI